MEGEGEGKAWGDSPEFRSGVPMGCVLMAWSWVTEWLRGETAFADTDAESAVVGPGVLAEDLGETPTSSRWSAGLIDPLRWLSDTEAVSSGWLIAKRCAGRQGPA